MAPALRPSRGWQETTDPRTRAALDRFGVDLLRLRAAAGISQRRLSRKSGVDQGTISRLERGLAPGVRVVSIAKLIVALDGTIVRSPNAPPAWVAALRDG